MDSTLTHINDLPLPYSTLTRHQRGLISSLYHYCAGNDKGKEGKVWGYNSFVWADNGRIRWKKVKIFGDYWGGFNNRKGDEKKFKRVKKKAETNVEIKIELKLVVRSCQCWSSMEQVRWANEELKTLDKMTRKVLTMNGAFHSERDVDRLYVSREDGGRAD